MIRLGLLAGLPRPLRPRVRIDTSEMSSGRRVYTVETLSRLRRLHAGSSIHFAVGSDSAASFGAWRRPEKLRSLCAWWTARRPGEQGAIPSFFRLLRDPMPDVSSTELRLLLALGEPLDGLAAKAVEAYIRRRGLYGTQRLEALRRSLAPERFAHTLAVAALAASLARRWGLDSTAALAAGLLHDVGRSVPVPRMPGYARRRRLAVPALSGILRHNPLLLHAYISADLARARFAVRDPAVLGAIRSHTLGSLQMTPLDRLLYVADAASADRGHPEAALIRAQAFSDMDAAFRAAVQNKIRHALASGSWLHPLTVSLWNSLQE